MGVQFDVQHAIDLVTGAGLVPGDVALAVGLAPEVLAGQGPDTLDLSYYFRIRSFVTGRVQDETCHLSSRQLLPGSTEFVRRHIPPEGTLTEAMTTVATSYNLLHGGEYNRVLNIDDEVVFQIDDTAFPYASGLLSEQTYFAMESTLVFLHAFLSMVAPRRAVLGLRRIRVKRPEAPELVSHLKFWKVPIEFGAETYQLVYDEVYAEQRARYHRKDGTVDDQIDHLLRFERPERRSAVEDTVLGFIDRGLIDQAAIATAMGVSPATLRRHLARHGLSFRDLRRSVLDRKAKTMLADGMPTQQISEELGFSDVRSFNRAFKAWNGVTPKNYEPPAMA